MTRIAGAGAYAPRPRVSADEFREAWGRFDAAGVESKAVPEADEDAVTMGYEAGRRALAAAGVSGADVEWLGFATTTPPMEEEDLTPRLASTLGVPETAATFAFAGSTRAGVQALEVCLDAAPEFGLVVASDCPRGAPDSGREHAAGAGAAAFVVGGDDGGAWEVERANYVEPYPGTRFRRAGSEEVESIGVTAYEREAYRTALAGAVDALAIDVSDVDAAAVQAPDGKLPYRVAGDLGLDAEQVEAAATVRELGDTGAASAPLGLARAFAEGAERTLVAGFGSGAGASALLFEGAAPADLALDAGADLTYADYLRRRGDLTSGGPEGGGAYVSVPSWRRTIPQRHRLVAGRCPECGALAFPPEGACSACGALVEYESVALPGTGTVEAVTTIRQGGAPPEFVEQQARGGDFQSAVVAFDGPEDGESAAGGSVSAPAQVVPGGRVERGDRVAATVRRVYEQEGVIRYGFKVAPAE